LRFSLSLSFFPSPSSKKIPIDILEFDSMMQAGQGPLLSMNGLISLYGVSKNAIIIY